MSIPRLDLDQAIAAMRTAIAPIEQSETVATGDALGRVLARSLTAPVSLPPFASSAMDGYAYAADSCSVNAPLQIVGTSLAGHPFGDSVGRQQCVRITTGAALPADTDTVVVQEDTRRDGDNLHIATPPAAGENVRAIGHDIEQGAALLTSGTRLNAFQVSWLAACGLDQIIVRSRPQIIVFSTGDELATPGEPLGPGQIYDSNRQLLQSLLAGLPVLVRDGGRLPDQPDAIRRALKAASSADLIITSGGVSVGDADYLTQIVAAEGTLEFWRLNLKPGKPLAFGQIGNARYLGLPGNPVSSAVTFLLVAKPAILALASASPEPALACRAELTAQVRHRSGREEFQRGYLTTSAGHSEVTPTGDQSSNRLSTFREANCLIRIPKDQNNLEKGQLVDVLPLAGLL